MIPVKFRKSAEASIASYDYVDIAEGTGVVVFNGGKAAVSGSAVFLLSRNTFYSDVVSSVNATTLNADFDLTPFNLPKTIKGTAYLSFGFYQVNAGGTGYIKIQIQKSSGGVVSNCSSEIYADPPVGAGAHKMCFVPISLTTTHFKKGDFLRCSMQITALSSNNEIGHDPMGRNGAYLTSALTTPPVTTKFQLYIPFQIDL